MSAEISGFEARDYPILAQATLTAAAILVETGVPAEDAYNDRGAEYAVMLTLVALRQMGILVDDIDERSFAEKITAIEHQTLPAKEWEETT